MNIYQISIRRKSNQEHLEYMYRDSKRDVEECIKNFTNRIIEAEVLQQRWFPVTTEGMLSALNHFGRHSDNG